METNTTSINNIKTGEYALLDVFNLAFREIFKEYVTNEGKSQLFSFGADFWLAHKDKDRFYGPPFPFYMLSNPLISIRVRLANIRDIDHLHLLHEPNIGERFLRCFVCHEQETA